MNYVDVLQPKDLETIDWIQETTITEEKTMTITEVLARAQANKCFPFVAGIVHAGAGSWDRLPVRTLSTWEILQCDNALTEAIRAEEYAARYRPVERQPADPNERDEQMEETQRMLAESAERARYLRTDSGRLERSVELLEAILAELQKRA